MSRYRGPKLRIIRRLGDLPGLTTKTTERLYPPGQHGPSKANKNLHYRNTGFVYKRSKN